MSDPEFAQLPFVPAERLNPHEGSQLLIDNFDQLDERMLVSAADLMIASAEKYLDRAANNLDTPAEKKLEPLEAFGLTFNALVLEVENETGIIHEFLEAVGQTKEIRHAAGEQKARIQQFSEAIFSDSRYENLYQAFQAIDPSKLDDQDRQRYAYYKKRYETARHSTSGEVDTTDLQERLNGEASKFRENRGKVARIRVTPGEFESLPADTRQQIQPIEHENAFIINLSEPTFAYILENGPRELRKRADEAFYGVPDNDRHIQEMAELRLQIARSEGKATWTEKQIEGLTLDTPEKVAAFYDSVKDGIVQRYQIAVAKLQKLYEADDNTSGQMQDYDLNYYAKKLREQYYDADKVTFTLSKTVRGLLDIGQELFGIQVVKSPDAPVYAEGVEAYTIYDQETNAELGSFYLDLLVRKDVDGEGGKRDGGAVYSLRYGQTVSPEASDDQKVQLPIAAVVANTAPPAPDGTEAKMSLRAVETLSHEILGHIIPTVLGRAKGPEISGDKLPFDIREIVSQACEYMVRDPALLLRLADEGVPEDVKQACMANMDMCQGVVEALNSMRLLRTMKADLELHGKEPSLDRAREASSQLMEPVGSDGNWIRKQVHMSNSYAGRYGSTYLLCDTSAKNIVTRLRNSGYHSSEGMLLRSILELAGRSGAGERLIAYASRPTIATIGATAIH